jgi:hypothetical protein
MEKRLYYFVFIILCALGTSVPFFIKADVFDELFKNVDFNKLAEDMEKAWGTGEIPAAPKPEEQATPTPTHFESVEKIISASPDDQFKDTRTLFLNPEIQTVEIKGKKRTEPTKKSRESLAQFKQEMDDRLKMLELNIQANKNLSPLFKEKYLPILREEADKIIIASELIDSKKVYQKLFFAPPEIQKSSRSYEKESLEQESKAIPDLMKELRRRYLSLIDRVKGLNKKIAISEEEESREEDKEKLEELAKQKIKEIPHSEKLLPGGPKIRGIIPTTKDSPDIQEKTDWSSIILDSEEPIKGEPL